MHSLPLGAVRYFRSEVFSAVPHGQYREHSLRYDVWSRIRVLDGALTMVTRGKKPREIVHAGDLFDVEPGVPHHLEAVGPSVSFVVDLYRVWPDTMRIDIARWENEGGTALRG
jgi:quercetin dioxygenase-like cupin family protein